eukprot:evm.model.scf_1524.3 EVM.evm.TU.scf_1524.3   scf_1524:18566-23824(+)
MGDTAGEEPHGGLRRSSRRSAGRSRNRMPSATHYIGYVEDAETPEMIMKKFEELDRIMAAGAGQPDPDEAECGQAGTERHDGGLNDQQLNELFKVTSMFTVQSALEGNELLFNGGEHFEDEGEGGGGAWSSEEDWFSDEEEEGAPRAPRRAPGARAGGRRPRAGGAARAGGRAGGAPRALARLRLLGQPKTEPQVCVLKVPKPPIPSSWGRRVKPFGVGPAEREGPDARRFEVGDVAAAAEEVPNLRGAFTAVLVNPGWDDGACGREEVDRAARRLRECALPRLVPRGFVFIWLRKSVLQKAWRVLTGWGYVYVENLTWVVLGANGRAARAPAPLCWDSHKTLYVFRKAGEGKDIQIRHQRSPDVVFDCMKLEKGGSWKVPDEVFQTIETMLPTTSGRLLELWASEKSQRRGWTHIVQKGG